MTNINLQKKAQVAIIAVGREGKMRVCRMRTDLPSAKASNSMFDVPEGMTLRQALMTLVAGEIKKASAAFTKAGRQANLEIYTVGQVAIKYYQMVAYLKGGHALTTEDIEAISSDRDTTADKCAYADMAEAIASAIAAGHGVHLQASGNAALFELIVPEGVEVHDGDILNFADGVAENGIQVRGWRNAKRQGAKVIVRGAKNPRAYISKAADPEKPFRGLDTLLKTIDGCWNSLPKAPVDKSNDDVDEEALYAA